MKSYTRKVKIGDKTFCFKELYVDNPYCDFKENDSFIKIYWDNKCIFEWDNEAQTDYPEDLTWERKLYDIFYKGFRLGYLLEKNDKGDTKCLD